MVSIKTRPPGYVDIKRKLLYVGVLSAALALIFAGNYAASPGKTDVGDEASQAVTKPDVNSPIMRISERYKGVIPAEKKGTKSHGSQPFTKGHTYIGKEVPPIPEKVPHRRIVVKSSEAQETDTSVAGGQRESEEYFVEAAYSSGNQGEKREPTYAEKLQAGKEEISLERELALYQQQWAAYDMVEAGMRVEVSPNKGEVQKDGSESDEDSVLGRVVSQYLEQAKGSATADASGGRNDALGGGDIVVRKNVSGRDDKRIRKGATIIATLNEGIDSEVPGIVTATINNTVFDTDTGRRPLIQAGSRLVGTYQTNKVGGNRLGVFWSEIQMPDGTVINIGAFPGADVSGVSGVPAKRESQFVRALGAAALLSVVTAGMEKVARASDTDTDRYESIYRQEASRNILGLGQKIIERSLSVADRFKTKPGTAITVRVTKDIVFE